MASKKKQKAARWEGRKRSRIGARSNALWIAPIPLLLTAFAQPPIGMATDIAAFFALCGAAHLTREGLKAQAAYDERAAARRPALPRKMLGSAATAGGLFLAGLPDIGAGIAFALLGGALHVTAFGIDPLRDKYAAGADRGSSARVAKAVEMAETHLGEMIGTAKAAGDPAFVMRVETFAATARRLFRRVEEDPRDLPAARRWLGVYLLGARDATVKYAALTGRPGDHREARADYFDFLGDLEDGFATRTETLLTDDRSDLQIEIDVLRDRLAREGVQAERDAEA